MQTFTTILLLFLEDLLLSAVTGQRYLFYKFKLFIFETGNTQNLTCHLDDERKAHLRKPQISSNKPYESCKPSEPRPLLMRKPTFTETREDTTMNHHGKPVLA